MSPAILYPLVIGETERQLLADLLEERITNLQGHKAALARMPDLVLVAGEGMSDLDEQIATCRGVLLLVSE